MNPVNVNAIDMISSRKLRTTRLKYFPDSIYVPAIMKVPSLRDVLGRNGALPQEALFLGQAEDDLPVLLNLHDPLPGPLLIVGQEGAGKTSFLQCITQFVVATHCSNEIQFGIITDRVQEWQDESVENPYCVGIFSNTAIGARQFIQSLAIWVSAMPKNKQSILLLIDGLEGIKQWDEKTRACLQYILSHGPEKRVWPIVTLHPEMCETFEEWLRFFKVRVFEYGLHAKDPKSILSLPEVQWKLPVQHRWFVLKEQTKWIPFWIPAIGE